MNSKCYWHCNGPKQNSNLLKSRPAIDAEVWFACAWIWDRREAGHWAIWENMSYFIVIQLCYAFSPILNLLYWMHLASFNLMVIATVLYDLWLIYTKQLVPQLVYLYSLSGYMDSWPTILRQFAFVKATSQILEVSKNEDSDLLTDIRA